MRELVRSVRDGSLLRIREREMQDNPIMNSKEGNSRQGDRSKTVRHSSRIANMTYFVILLAALAIICNAYQRHHSYGHGLSQVVRLPKGNERAQVFSRTWSPCSFATMGYYGPNNQVLSHVEGIHFAHSCGCAVVDVMIQPHHTSSSRGTNVSLSMIFEEDAVPLQNFAPTCYLSVGPLSEKRLRSLKVPVTWKNQTLFRLLNDMSEVTCEQLLSCKQSILHFSLRKHFHIPQRRKVEFSRTIADAAESVLAHFPFKGPFNCVMFRQRDEYFFDQEDPYKGLLLCQTFSSTKECLERLVQNQRLNVGVLPTLVVSATPPKFWKSLEKERIYFASIVGARDPNIQVFVDMAACSRARSIAYMSNKKVSLGAGGSGPSTLYEVLVEMGRNTSLDLTQEALIGSNFNQSSIRHRELP